jgi:channel protein (hemolysin III family)
MSGGYHLLGPGTGRFVLKQLDIAGVFALIAGTVTPIHAILFKGFHRWAPLLLVWAVAITGITLRSIFSDALPSGIGTAIFLAMGWGGAISCIVLWKRYGFDFVRPLFLGGLAYTAGALCHVFHSPVIIPGILGPHEVWHIAVLCGLGLHWSFVFSFAAGPPQLLTSNNTDSFGSVDVAYQADLKSST